MKRMVRIPNKLIVIACFMVAMAVVAVPLWGDSIMLAVATHLEDNGNIEGSHQLYSAIATAYEKSERRAEALLRLAQQLPPFSEAIAPDTATDLLQGSAFFPTGMGLLGAHHLVNVPFKALFPEPGYNEAVAQKISLLTSVLDEYPNSEWSLMASAELAHAYAFLGRYGEALRVLSDARKEGSPAITDPAVALTFATTYRFLHALAEAQEVLESVLDVEAAGPLAIRVRLELADILERRNQPEAALGLLNSLQNDPLSANARESLNAHIERLEASISSNNDDLPAITGTVIVNGQGMEGVRVLIVEERSTGNGGLHPVAQTVTDASGYFALQDLDPGTYIVEYMLPLYAFNSAYYSTGSEPAPWNHELQVVVDDSTTELALHMESSPWITSVEIPEDDPYPVLRVTWEEVPHATDYIAYLDTYWLDVGYVSGGRRMEWQVSDTTIEIPLDESIDENFRSASLYFNTLEVLGLRARNPIVTIGVNPHIGSAALSQSFETIDEETGSTLSWQRYQLFHVEGYWVELPRPDLLEPDRHLLEGRIPEAIAGYKAILADDPNDVHSLFVLWALRDRHPDAVRLIELDEALMYAQRLLELDAFAADGLRYTLERSVESLQAVKERLSNRSTL